MSLLIALFSALGTGYSAIAVSADSITPRSFYFNAGGDTRFHDAYALSDGTLLVAGEAPNLNWVPVGVPQVVLGLDQIASSAPGKTGFILQVSADLNTVLAVASFPTGSVRSVFKIRGTEVPGDTTGALYISGHRDTVANNGYYIARLDQNFVDGLPTALAWGRNINNRSEADGGNSHKSLQPWDVGSDGKVVFVEGKAFDPNWVGIYRLNASGNLEVVDKWRTHWTTTNSKWFGAPASSAPAALSYSGIVMKNGRLGQMRSADATEYAYLTQDENGNAGRKGMWPDDYYFRMHCAYVSCDTGQPGYTGYRMGANPTQRVGSVVIDRRTNDIYFGYSTQSKLPDGNPDFEPAVVAMGADGALHWWARLYRETTQNSTPDQFVDGLEVDYANDRLVVLARSHGNNTYNFWAGDQITASPGASGYQNRFSGTNGNIHISWLGKYGLADGRIYNATWVAELTEDASAGTPSTDPIMGGWPDPNQGWPNLNTTKCRSKLSVYADGSVLVTCSGRRTATTTNAFQSMPLPGQLKGTWNDFVRVYKPDLSGLRYSSLLTGAWNKSDGTGGGNTTLSAAIPFQTGLVTIGYQAKNSTTGVTKGVPIPTANIPTWGKATPVGENALMGLLPF